MNVESRKKAIASKRKAKRRVECLHFEKPPHDPKESGKSAAFLQAKTLSCSSRDAGCTRGRLLVLKLVGGWCLPPRRFNIADCPPSLCVAEALAEWLLAGRGAACWGVARAGARGGRQGGRRGGRMLRKTRQTRPLQSMRRSLIHSKWLENGTFIRSQLTLDPVSH